MVSPTWVGNLSSRDRLGTAAGRTRKRKKMMRDELSREGRQKTSGAQIGDLVSEQGAAAGQGTKTRHRVPARLMDVTSPMCAVLEPVGSPSRVTFRDLLVVLHVSGDGSDTRLLQPTQISETTEGDWRRRW
jgi:hypothetical protein